MYRKILVPVDGSKRAEKILPHVQELAIKFDAELVLAQIIEPLYHTATIDNISYYQVILETLEQLKIEAGEYLDQLQKSLHAEGVKVKTRIEQGAAVATLLTIAEDEQVDLIALGSHGRTGLKRVYYGSVAAGILNGTERPLLMIRGADS